MTDIPEPTVRIPFRPAELTLRAFVDGKIMRQYRPKGLAESVESVLAELDRLRGQNTRLLEQHIGGRVYLDGGKRFNLRIPRVPNRCDDLDCTYCGKREVVKYGCVECAVELDVPGEWQWYWQGHCHGHEDDDEFDLAGKVDAHVNGTGHAGFAPMNSEAQIEWMRAKGVGH